MFQKNIIQKMNPMQMKKDFYVGSNKYFHLKINHKEKYIDYLRV